MQTQPEIPPTDEKHASVWPAWLGWSLMLFVVYALSIGPVFGLTVRGYLPANATTSDFFHYLYAPLNWVCDNTPLQKPMDSYIDWWTRGHMLDMLK